MDEKTIAECCSFDYFNRYPCEGVQDCSNCNRFICCDCTNPEKYHLIYSAVDGMAKKIAALRSQVKDAEEVVWSFEAYVREEERRGHLLYFPTLAAYRTKYEEVE